MRRVTTTPVGKAARPRGLLWVSLLIGWVPVWAFYAALIVLVHGAPVTAAMNAAARAIGFAAVLGLVVLWLSARFPWPRPMTLTFAAGHVVGAVAFSSAWMALMAFMNWLHGGGFRVAPPGPSVLGVVGTWLYLAVAGVSYASRATARAAEAEATAARSKLAALRAQLDPHFLFNALHSVVQLIPVEPARASQAAEQLADLLRAAIDEERDLVPLADELAFVDKYLALEAMRFGPRLSSEVNNRLARDDAPLVPPFVLLTLVENAVRHGASPKVEPTHILIGVQRRDERLELTVLDDGAGADPSTLGNGGTGLRRMRERLDALYGSRAGIEAIGRPGHGFTVIVTLPFARAED